MTQTRRDREAYANHVPEHVLLRWKVAPDLPLLIVNAV